MLAARSESVIERELRFTSDDVQLFAAASGDCNPLHLDAEFCRQTSFGVRIVHGALVAIGLLGLVPADELARMRSLRFWFGGAVLLDSPYAARASASEKRPGAWEVRLTGRGKVLTRVVAQTDGRAFSRSPHHVPAASAELDHGAEARAMRTAPQAIRVEQLEPGHTISGRYCAGPELLDVAARFGAPLEPALLEGLAWASYVVGMEIPGLHALFAGLTLTASDDAADDTPAARQTITLRGYDDRAGRVLLDGVLSADSGAPRCFAAIDAFDLPPVPTLDPEALGISDSPHERAGAVVVIGGSRGFGAALTLALLGRGFEVHGVYAGSADAAADLVRLAGPHRSKLHMHRFDAGDPDAVQALVEDLRAADTPVVGLVLNAAPAPLAMGVTSGSGIELADYVADSLRLVAVPLGALLPIVSEASGWIVFCSSAAVTAPPREWPHYVTAKSALEGLAAWVAAAAPEIKTVVLRPPAMRTGMTNTPSGRIASLAPERIATWIADRISTGELPAGLSLQDPCSPELGTP
jgi:NAD(P)-dependent dehydrogenase (short-subunit alcohol dehydrogenase family)/acyl dehydratase